MRLHTRIAQCNVGMIASKPSWQLFFSIELTPEEAGLVHTYRLGDRLICKYTASDGSENYLQLKDAVGNKRGYVLVELGLVNAMKLGLVQGCARFRDFLKQIIEVRAGGGVESFDYPLHSDEVNRSASSTPTNDIPVPPIINQTATSQEAPPTVSGQQRDSSSAPPKRSPIILGDAPAG